MEPWMSFFPSPTRAVHWSLLRANSFHSTSSHRSYIILPPTLKSSKWAFCLKFPHQKNVCISVFPMCATCPTSPILHVITVVMLGEDCESWSFSSCSFLQSRVTSPQAPSSASSPAPCSRTLWVCVPLWKENKKKRSFSPTWCSFCIQHNHL